MPSNSSNRQALPSIPTGIGCAKTQRRNKRAAMERRRVAKFDGPADLLKRQVDHRLTRNGKPTKLQVLSAAIEHIAYLQSLLEQPTTPAPAHPAPYPQQPPSYGAESRCPAPTHAMPSGTPPWYPDYDFYLQQLSQWMHPVYPPTPQ